MPRYAVTGSTGRLGPLVIAGMLGLGIALDPGTLDGVERLLLISGSEVGNRIAEHTSVVNAAMAAGVRHLLYTSVHRAACVTALTQDSHRNAVYGLGGPPFTIFVAAIQEGIARGDVCTDSHDLARLIQREPAPLAQVIAAAA